VTRTLRFFQNVVDEDFSFIGLLTSYDPKPVVFSRKGFAPIIKPTRAE
jgi:hypothetical protein